MSDLTIHSRDTLAFTVEVRREGARTPFDLTGATVQVLAGQGGAASLTGTATVASPASAGRIEVSFPAAALSVGAWTVETIVASGGETQTVSSLTVSVLSSLTAAP